MTVPGRRAMLLTLSLIAAIATSPAAAGAAGCDAPTSKPFAPWLDYANYSLVPGGDFEAGRPSWTLKGASIVDGNESFSVTGGGSRSLSIPRGASATSPVFCAGLDHPTLRLFAKGGGLLGLLNVTVNYTDASSVLRSQSLGLVTPSARWSPSLPIATLSGLPLLTGSTMSVRLTAIGAGFTVDDVFVDPFGGR